jgi:hypothetical protein
MAVCGIALLLASVAGCSAPPPLPIDVNGTWTTRAVDRGEVTLSVPSDWNVGEAWIQPSSFTDLVGSFSNQPLSPPCTTGPNTIGCGLPLQSLQADAVLVEIWQNSFSNWNLDSEPGTPTTVSGLTARVADQSGGAGYCGGLGADRTRREFIPFPSAPDNWIEIDICSHGVADTVGARIMGSIAVSLSP